jgi:hypothetical protein
MKATKRGISSFTLAFAAVMFGTSGQSATHEATCKPIRAQLEAEAFVDGCNSPVDFCAAGAISRDGWLAGETEAVMLGLAPGAGLSPIVPDGTLAFVGDRTISTRFGSLTLRITGVFDTVTGEFSEFEQVASGTGGFRDATGTLYLAGTSPTPSTFVAEITGTLCVGARE